MIIDKKNKVSNHSCGKLKLKYVDLLREMGYSSGSGSIGINITKKQQPGNH